MIFGEQQNVEACCLMPSMGPDDIRKQMEDAIKTFDDPEQVLFLIDLWGGTPFNQASALIKGHEDTWAIITGMNLPMLIETYAARFSMENAHEIATKVAPIGQEGIKTLPESLMPETKAAAAEVPANSEPTGAIPPGTVLGDGKIKYVLARVDSRLLHGQVATAWTKAVQPSRIIVVSDGVAHDNMRKSLIEQAAPPGVRVNVVPIKKMEEVAKDPRFGNTKAMLLFENPEDALTAIKGGVDLKELNIGSMAHSQGKVAVNKVISLDQKDIDTFNELKKMGVKFDVRKVPADSKEDMEPLLKKAEAELK